jgi:hypothetical protein
MPSMPRYPVSYLPTNKRQKRFSCPSVVASEQVSLFEHVLWRFDATVTRLSVRPRMALLSLPLNGCSCTDATALWIHEAWEQGHTASSCSQLRHRLCRTREIQYSIGILQARMPSWRGWAAKSFSLTCMERASSCRNKNPCTTCGLARLRIAYVRCAVVVLYIPMTFEE